MTFFSRPIVTEDGTTESTAFKLIMIESVARQLGCPMDEAHDRVSEVWNKHLNDAVSVRGAIGLITEAMELKG